MNSVWLKSPSIKFDSRKSKYNETLRSEARFLQKLSKINEFHVENLKLSAKEGQQKSSKETSKHSPENTVRITVLSNENLSPGKCPKNEAHEIHLTVTSRSVSCLQRKNISASTTVLKIHSKTTLEKKESKSSKFLDTNINSEKDGLATSPGNSLNGTNNGSEENGEAGVELEILVPAKRAKRTSSSNKKKKNQSSSNGSRSTEDRTIGDALFCCPFELVEIYSVKQEHPLDFSEQLSNIHRDGDSIRTFPKEDGESSESATLEECICPFPEIRSDKVEEGTRTIGDSNTKSTLQSDYEASSATLRNKDTSVEPTRDRRGPNSVKVEVDLTKGNRTTQQCDLSDVGKAIENGIEQYEVPGKFNFTSISEEGWKFNLREKQEKTDEKIGLERSEESKGCFRYHTKCVRCSPVIRNNPPVSRFGKSCTKSDEALLSACKTSVKDVAPVENKDLIAIEKEDEKVKSQDIHSTSFSYKSSASNNNNLLDRDSTGSSGSGISKLMDSKRSSSSGSETDPSSLENTVIDLKEKKPNSGRKNSDNESLRDKIKVIIEKRQTEKDNANVKAIIKNKTDACDEETRMSKVDDGEGEHRVPETKTTRIEIKDPKIGIIKCETERANINYEHIKICKVLMKIHEHLSCDWQKMECIRMKLRGAIPIDSIESVTTLQLLDKTIARCKSYIHGSNDSSKAESEITTLLSKYVIQLVKAVNKNKLALEEQERHFSRVHSKSQEQHLNKKRKVSDELALSSNVWTEEISCLIETISSLVKNIMADNEEKENVNSSRKYKLMNGRVTNMLSTNDTKQRRGVVRSKIMKGNLAKEGSHIETQISNPLNSINSMKQSNSKTFLKIVNTPRSREKEKLPDVAQTKVVEKKMNDSCRHPEKRKVAQKPTQLNANANQSKQSIFRQRGRITSNVQPVWRPGGAVKIPSSSSATMLTQKPRPLIHVKERMNQPIENANRTCSNKRGNSLDHITTERNLFNVEKNMDDNRNREAKICNYLAETKQERTAVESKKKVFMETYSIKDILPTWEVDNSKVLSKRSKTSVKTSPRRRPRPGTLRATSKSCNCHLQHGPDSASSKNPEKASYEKTARQRTSKESKFLRVLEDIIKSTPMEKKGSKSTRNLVDYQLEHEANSVRLELQAESTLDKEEVKISEEEPTRDIDTSQFVKTRPKVSEMVRENPPPIEKLPRQRLALLSKDFSPFSITNLKEDIIDAEVSASHEISQLNHRSSSVTVSDASCMVDFNSSSDSIANIEPTKCCQTSFNSISSSSTSHQEQKNEKHGKCDNSQAHSADCNQDRQMFKRPSVMRKERSKVNSHALSLSTLKEFLCDQCVDVDLVDKAERYLEEKQRTLRFSRKKRVNLIDVPSSARNLQHECYCEYKSKGNIGNHEKDSVECKEGRKDADNVSSYPLLQSPLERKDATTCTTNCSSDASSQTDLQRKFTKSLQTIFERDIFAPVKQETTETQTEMASVKHVASECREMMPKEIKNLTMKSKDASSMTEPLLISDCSTETVQVSYASKSVATDHVDRIQNGSTKEDSRQKFDNFSEMSIEICNEECTEEKTNEDDEDSEESCYHAFNKLLNQMYECYDSSSTTSKKNDEACEFCFVKSNVSASFSSPNMSSVCSENCVCNETMTHKESHELSVKVVSSEMLAALQVDAIRACNIYRAIDLYKRNLKRKLRKLEKQKNRVTTAKRNTEMRKRTLKNVSKRSSVGGISRRHLEHFDKNGVADVLKALRRTEVATTSSKESRAFRNASKRKISESVSMTSTSTSCSGYFFAEADQKISKKSLSNVALKDVTSVMEFLVRQTENAKLEHTRCVQNISKGTCSRFRNRKMKSERMRKQNGSFIFSRENLLPVVYGVVCCIVFWCLQFTITCDIIL